MGQLLRSAGIVLSVAFLLATARARAEPEVRVRNGTYSGLHLAAFEQDIFLGMPYAQDSGGQNRFRVPQALADSWKGSRAAKQYGPACPDEDVEADAVYGMSENCLSINVVRPAGVKETAALPVLFWIHGGSYQTGTSSLDWYNLTYIVQRSVELGKPIIAASINYRKGGWGLLYSVEVQGSGNTNLALRDMRHGLAWVQENIRAFGGDPTQVTIWGESAGSFAVGQLLLAYGGRSDGLFHRSIQQSGSASTAWYNGSDRYQPIYDKIVDQVNCSSAPDTLGCLRGIPYNILYPFMASSKVAGPGFYPTVDGDIIPNYPSDLLRAGRFAHVPHLYGTNTDEGTANAPVGVINTDDDLRQFLLHGTGFDFPNATVSRIMELYPDDAEQGIPQGTGRERFADLGWQYKRAAAIMGDVFYHAPRQADARQYARHAPTYVYRFNSRAFVNATNATHTDQAGSLAPAASGVAHASELPFVFRHPARVGPWPEYVALSRAMADRWIDFVHCADPNGGQTAAAAAAPRWPRYDEGADGLNLVLQTESQGGLYVEPDTYRLAGREYLTQWARRRHV